MATEELVTEQFQFLGIDVPKEVVVKCEYPMDRRVNFPNKTVHLTSRPNCQYISTTEMNVQGCFTNHFFFRCKFVRGV